MRDVEGSPPGHWDRPLAGSLDRLTVRSVLLEDNPLGDPAVRPLYVYRPPNVPGATERLPSVYLLQGFGGKLEEWLVPLSSGPTTIERVDSMISRGESPPALLVFVDAATSWGGSQFLNSPSSGRYLDYLCEEVVPFVDARYPTGAAMEHRGVCSLAGDALFECCYQPFFPVAARVLRIHFNGSWEEFEARAQSDDFDWREFPVLFAAYGTACAYTPDPNRPGRARIPFDSVGRPIDEIWSEWLALDPVRMAQNHADALARMHMIQLDAGHQDQFFLDLGAAAFSAELTRLGIEHSLELFDGDHETAGERIPAAIAKLIRALQ